MAMDLCINEKDEERESEAQSDVRAKKRAAPQTPLPCWGAARPREWWGGARFFALTTD